MFVRVRTRSRAAEVRPGEDQTEIIRAAGSSRRRLFGSLVTMASRRSRAWITTDASITSDVLVAPQSSPQERATCSSRAITSTSSLRRNRANATLSTSIAPSLSHDAGGHVKGPALS